MTEEKSAGYVRLVESFDEPGCPICRCVVRESRSHLDAILYEPGHGPRHPPRPARLLGLL
jgi:hypothetical protein